MMGDSLGKDCAPARQLGLGTVWFLPASVEYTQFVAKNADAAASADFVVRDLQELVEICLGAD